MPIVIADDGPTQCKNGGTLVNNADGTRYCNCQPLFAGVDCGVLLCMNGGTPINGMSCLCPDGYSGNQCQNGG